MPIWSLVRIWYFSRVSTYLKDNSTTEWTHNYICSEGKAGSMLVYISLFDDDMSRGCKYAGWPTQWEEIVFEVLFSGSLMFTITFMDD